jgi:CBS domain-containing protein
VSIEEQSVRSMYLLGGRRVQLRDLLDAQLLKPGAELRFDRKRIGRTYRAEVTAAGRVLLPDGQEFPSPSRAAMVAAHMRAVDGWLAWTVVETGRPLDAFRQELLDRAVRVAVEDEQPREAALDQRVHERLREARKRADSGEPEEISVRELLTLWGVTGRGDQISRIEADLENHGLTTSPNFRKVTLDATVRLLTAGGEPEDVVTSEEGSAAALADEDGAEDQTVGLTVGNLASALGGVTWVSPNASFEEAITKMLLNDFSQLAVLSGPRDLRGAVTWQTIAHARHVKAGAKLCDAIDENLAEVVRYDKELIDILPILQRVGFVFVRDLERKIAGIVTTADVAAVYGDMAMPFFQIGELDRSLRRIIARNFAIEEVAALCGRAVHSFDELSMGEYQRVLENGEIWTRLGWPLDRGVFIERLSEIRKIRNDVMHFNPDAPPPGTIEKLRKLNTLLRQFGD